MNKVKSFLNNHPAFKGFLEKLGKDNIGMLAAFVSWSVLTSLVPIAVGLIFIATLFLHSPSTQHAVESKLSAALLGVISRHDLQAMVKGSLQHSGLLGVIGILGVLWGGSNVGGSLSTAFQAIFEVPGRNFFKEKLIDVGMIVVFTALLLVTLIATAAGAFLDQIFHSFPLSGASTFVIGTGISLVSAFLLFFAIYLVFPPIKPPFRLGNVWKGALLGAVLFQILTYIWPLYSHFANVGRYASILGALAILTTWVYFFAMITMIGAEVVAVGAIREAEREGKSVGPRPQENVPQHKVLRDVKQKGSSSASGPQPSSAQTGSSRNAGHGTTHSAGHDLVVEQRPSARGSENGSRDHDGQVQHDGAFWLWAAAPLVVGTVAGLVEVVRGGERRR